MERESITILDDVHRLVRNMLTNNFTVLNIIPVHERDTLDSQRFCCTQENTSIQLHNPWGGSSTAGGICYYSGTSRAMPLSYKT